MPCSNRLLPRPCLLLACLAAGSIAAAVSAAASGEITTATYPPAAGPGGGKHVVLLAGDEEYRSEEGLPQLAKILSQRLGFRCTVLFSLNDKGEIDPNNGASISGAEALDSADAIVMLLRYRKWPDAECQRFLAAYERGIPIIGLRTSTHAFNLPSGKYAAQLNSFGKNVLGERWVNHWGRHKSEATRGVIEPSAKDLPIMRGVADIFGDTDVYEAYPPSDAQILVRGQVLKGMKPDDAPADYRRNRSTDKQEQGINDPMMPVAWTRLHKNEAGKTNRVFCTTMGSSTDLQNEGLRRLVVNAVFWGLELDVPAKADVSLVGDYKPTPYGFNGYIKGRKPADALLDAKSPAPDQGPAPNQGAANPAEKKMAKKEAVKVAEANKDYGKKPGVNKDGEKRDPLRATLPGSRPAEPRAALAPSKLPLEFNVHERIAFVGGSLAERFNLFGAFETLLHTRFADKELVVRNFARPADEVVLRQRPNDYTKLDDPLTAFEPDTFLCFFGFNESYAGPGGVDAFRANYLKYLDEMTAHYPRGEAGAPRFVLVTPIAFESPREGKSTATPRQILPVSPDLLPSGERENANLKLYAAAVAEVAKERGLAVIDLHEPSSALFAREPGLQYTINGCHLNAAGDLEISLALAAAITGQKLDSLRPADNDGGQFERLREAVNDKSWVHSQDYRMLNGWYVYGGRRTWDTETFPREFIKIRNMVAVRDRRVWTVAQGKSVVSTPDDTLTGELLVPPTRFGLVSKSEAESPRVLSPEADLATFTTPPGFEAKLFASEQQFPQLSKPCQIGFDNRGRLWASCMPTYPQWLPGDGRPSDRLLIFEDTDHDGRADVCKSFYDKLHCPTGFEFWQGGVLVVDQPRLLWLKDTDGDDRADVVVHLIDGWATDDTHHTIGAFEWSHGGLLHMMEGVSMSTTLETPWGPFHNMGSSGTYRLDPRTLRVTHFNTPGYGNPWCYVFNPWGQGFCGDGTGGNQHWDSPLSGAQFRGRRGLNPIFDNEGMRPVVGTEFLYTRQFPDNVQGQFIYACVINMNGLTRFTVADDGAGFRGARLKHVVDDKPAPDDLLTSTDKHFRPTDPQIGPDGCALVRRLGQPAHWPYAVFPARPESRPHAWTHLPPQLQRQAATRSGDATRQADRGTARPAHRVRAAHSLSRSHRAAGPADRGSGRGVEDLDKQA